MKQRREEREPATTLAGRGRRWPGRIVVFTLVVVALGIGGWKWRQTSHGPLPELDLGHVTPAVVLTIQEHVRAVKADPGSGAAWGWLGALLWAYDFRPQGIHCLREAERLEPSNPRWPYFLGLGLQILAPGEGALKFQRAAQLCGNEPEAPRFRYAFLLAEQGRWTEATPELEQLLAAKPDFAPARLLRARAAQAQGDPERALELARACTRDPRMTRSGWALLGALLRQQGDLPGAEQAFQRSAAAPPDEGVADPYQAEVTLLRGDARALSEQAHPLLAAGRLNEAAALIERLLRNHSSFPDTWLLQGRLEYIRKNYETAERALLKFLELSPRSTQGLFQLGSVFLAQGRFGEAADVFGQATALKPDFGAAYFNRGLALGRAARKEEAVAAFRESLRYNPEHLLSYLLMADLQLQLGQLEEARDLLKQAEAIEPGNPRLQALRNRLSPPVQP